MFIERFLPHDNELLENKAREAAKKLAELSCVEMVFLTGSVATRRTGPDSDIDLIVIYDPDQYDLAQEKIGGLASPVKHCLPRAEFKLGNVEGGIDILEISHEDYAAFIERGENLCWRGDNRRYIKESRSWKVLVDKR